MKTLKVTYLSNRFTQLSPDLVPAAVQKHLSDNVTVQRMAYCEDKDGKKELYIELLTPTAAQALLHNSHAQDWELKFQWSSFELSDLRLTSNGRASVSYVRDQRDSNKVGCEFEGPNKHHPWQGPQPPITKR